MHTGLALVSVLLAADPYAALSPGKPTIPATLKAFTPGMTEAALKAALKVSDDDPCLAMAFRVRNLCVLPFIKEGRYTHLSLLFPSLANTRAALTKRWGAPIVYERSWYWVNPEAKLRAALRDQDEPAQLELEPYLPLKDLLGEGPGFPFEHTPILGSTRATIEKAYGVTCEADGCSLSFPPCEVEWGGQHVQIELTGGLATQVTLILPTRTPERLQLTLALLEKKWGARSPVEGEPRQFHFERAPSARLIEGPGDALVSIRR